MSRIQLRMEDLGGLGEAGELSGAAFPQGRFCSEAFSSIAAVCKVQRRVGEEEFRTAEHLRAIRRWTTRGTEGKGDEGK